jgi:hypothetical protein
MRMHTKREADERIAVSYADFIFVSLLQCLKRVDQKIFDRYLAQDSAFGALYDASKEWLEKDD